MRLALLVAAPLLSAALLLSAPVPRAPHLRAPRLVAPALPLCSRCRVPIAAASGPVAGARQWLSKWWKFDKKQIAALGADAFFTYGFVSNVNAGLFIGLSWFTFMKQAGLSPLVPGQWGKFLATYLGIYATVGTVMRPFRLALAVGLTPTFSKCVAALQRRLPFYDTRRKVNRTLAMVVVSLFGNIGVTSLVTFCGVSIASLLTGVPAVPHGWRLFGSKAAEAVVEVAVSA
jgi:hypothetical protein